MNNYHRLATAAQPPHTFVVCETGANHDGDIGKAMKLVQIAKDVGADAIKFQLFRADTQLSNQSDRHTVNRKQLKDLELSVTSFGCLRGFARELGLKFVLTLFSADDSLEFRRINPDVIAVASPDAVNFPLLDAAIAMARPLIVSLGTCDQEEADSTVDYLERHVAVLAYLHCVSAYPVPRQKASLGSMRTMIRRGSQDLPIGYSDHTEDRDLGAAAVLAGACVVEKHLTYSPAAQGPDHAMSLCPVSMNNYIKQIRMAENVLGPRHKTTWEMEAHVRKVSRQSVCATCDIYKGDTIKRTDVTIKRPGTGIPAMQVVRVWGRRALEDIKQNDIILESQVDWTRRRGD